VTAAAERPASRLAWLRVVPEVGWAAVSTAAFAVALLARLGGGPRWAVAGLYAVCYAAGGWEPGLARLQALRRRTLDVDVLMVVAALAAAAIGQVFDGALLIVIFATSGALEAVMTQRTAASVRALLDFAPQSAVRLGPAGDSSRSPQRSSSPVTSSWSAPASGSPATAASRAGRASSTRPR